MAQNFYLIRYINSCLPEENFPGMTALYHIKNVIDKKEAVEKLCLAKFLEKICFSIGVATLHQEDPEVTCATFCTPVISLKLLDPPGKYDDDKDYTDLYIQYIYDTSSLSDFLALFENSENEIFSFKLINADEEFVQFLVSKGRIDTKTAIVLE